MDYNFFPRNYFMISVLLIEYGRGKKNQCLTQDDLSYGLLFFYSPSSLHLIYNYVTYISIHTHNTNLNMYMYTYMYIHAKSIFLKLFLLKYMLRKRYCKLLFNFGPCDFLPSSVKTKSKLCLGTFPCISFQLHRESLVEGTFSVLCSVYCLRLTCYDLSKFNTWHFFLLLLIVPVVSFPGCYGLFYPQADFW